MDHWLILTAWAIVKVTRPMGNFQWMVVAINGRITLPQRSRASSTAMSPTSLDVAVSSNGLRLFLFIQYPRALIQSVSSQDKPLFLQVRLISAGGADGKVVCAVKGLNCDTSTALHPAYVIMDLVFGIKVMGAGWRTVLIFRHLLRIQDVGHHLHST